MTLRKKSAFTAKMGGKRRKKTELFKRMRDWFADRFRRENRAQIGMDGIRPVRRRNLGFTQARLGTAFMCMMLGLVIWAGYQFASHWTLFQLNESEIRLSGARTLTERQVLVLAGLVGRPEAGLNNLSLDTRAIGERLEAHPRIASARVKKRWPAGLSVELTEYEPFALAAFKDGPLRQIDRTGHIIGEASEGGDLDFPVVTGLTEADVENGDLGVRAQGALQVLRLAARGNAILPMRTVSEVRVGEGGEVVLFLADHPFPINFGVDRMQAKFNDLLSILKQLYDSGEIGQVASLEMGYGDNRNKMLCRWTQPR